MKGLCLHLPASLNGVHSYRIISCGSFSRSCSKASLSRIHSRFVAAFSRARPEKVLMWTSTRPKSSKWSNISLSDPEWRLHRRRNSMPAICFNTGKTTSEITDFPEPVQRWNARIFDGIPLRDVKNCFAKVLSKCL